MGDIHWKYGWWTPDELDILKKLYPDNNVPMGEIVQKLKRKEYSIRDKARQLKLKREIRRKWTLEKDMWLCQLRRDNYSNSEIADIMGCSKRSVAYRLSAKGYILHHYPKDSTND